MADSQVLRWLDELNGVTDADQKARDIKAEIKRIRKEPSSLQNRRRIKALYADLDAIQFKPDYMCVIMDKERDYLRACQGFYVNGMKFYRLLGTNGGVKNSTIVFVSERHIDEIRRRIDNGRNMEQALVPAKLEAYKALACSASTPVSMPHGILVVPDCETHFLSDVVYLSDENDGEPEMEPRSGVQIDLNASDGYGLMCPALAARWSEELQLDYVVSGANSRMSWWKGMFFTFDFHEFADKVAGKYIVKDAWGMDVDIRDVELVVTTSMLKLWDSYESCADYLANCEKNHYTFGIAKVCPKELENEHNLNYQFIQSFALSDDDMRELIVPTMNEIEDVLNADHMKTILYLRGFGINDDNVADSMDDIAKAMMIDPRMLNDPHTQSKVYQLIKNRIDEAKVGVIKVHGNYSIVCGDPYALCQSIFGMDVTGLLKAGEIYNEFWANNPSDSLACFRAPMSTHENIRKVHPARGEEVRHWFQYIHTGTVFNSWDTATAALNGMD